jgi:DNA-binding MarR family transcriptional regulator
MNSADPAPAGDAGSAANVEPDGAGHGDADLGDAGLGSAGAGLGGAGLGGAGSGSADTGDLRRERGGIAPAGPGAAGLDRAANVLGALSLVIADQAADAIAEAAGRSESGAAALSALLHFLDRPSIDLLRQVLGLTSSGTVRLIDRLEESGYVRREAGADGRSTSVVLTPDGELAGQRVAAARAEVLRRAMAGLSDGERSDLDGLVGKMLVGMMRGPGATRWICRLCDIGVCRGAPGGCPVGNAALKRYSH